MSCKVALCLILALLLVSCAKQPPSGLEDAPGFFVGLLHGFLVVPSLVGSIWWDVRIYSFPNNGIWYDQGFVIGACEKLIKAARDGRYAASIQLAQVQQPAPFTLRNGIQVIREHVPKAIV